MFTKKANCDAGEGNFSSISWFVILIFTVLSLFFIALNTSIFTFDVTVPFTGSLTTHTAENSSAKSSQDPSDKILDPETSSLSNVSETSNLSGTPDNPSYKILDSETSSLSNVSETSNLSETSDNPNVSVNQKPEKPDDCMGKYIHILDLPSEFNTDVLKNCSTLNPFIRMCRFIVNNGLGPKLNVSDNSVFSDSGWYVTDQFTLEIIFHNRMKEYRCLTDDSAKASAIYVPYYAGLEVGRNLWHNNLPLRDATPIRFIQYVTQRPEWKRMRGKDHFLVMGRVSGDFRRYTDNTSEFTWGNHLLHQPEAMNMTSLLIEADLFSKSDIAIPYPTFFHPSSEDEVQSWQQKMREKNRTHLFSFAGAPRPNQKDSIRNYLIMQCLAAVDNCLFMNCNRPDIVDCSEPEPVMRLFQSSDFCLQPPGDSYTRKSFFDTILAGCIPVILHPASAYLQYVWHLPKDYTSYSVFLPMDEVRSGSLSIEKRLLEIPKEKVQAMREEVIKLIPRIVYAKPSSDQHGIEDAFEVAVKGVLDRVSMFKKAIEGTEHSMYESVPAQLAWKYNFFGDLEHNEWDKYMFGG